MCYKEYIQYTCGHRSFSVVRPCPMTTENPSFPCCTIMPSLQHMALTMCCACERTLHARWVVIREWEHRWFHQRGACACDLKFPGPPDFTPRPVGATDYSWNSSNDNTTGGATAFNYNGNENIGAAGVSFNHNNVDTTRFNYNAYINNNAATAGDNDNNNNNNENAGTPGRNNANNNAGATDDIANRFANVNMTGTASVNVAINTGDNANKTSSAASASTSGQVSMASGTSGTNETPLTQETDNCAPNLVAVRLPSLFAAEWLADHRARHEAGLCKCTVNFQTFEPVVTDTELTPEERAMLRDFRQHGEAHPAVIDLLGHGRGMVAQYQYQAVVTNTLVSGVTPDTDGDTHANQEGGPSQIIAGISHTDSMFGVPVGERYCESPPEMGGPPPPLAIPLDDPARPPNFATPEGSVYLQYARPSVQGHAPPGYARLYDNPIHVQSENGDHRPLHNPADRSASFAADDDVTIFGDVMTPRVRHTTTTTGRELEGEAFCGLPIGAGPEGVPHTASFEECILRRGPSGSGGGDDDAGAASGRSAST